MDNDQDATRRRGEDAGLYNYSSTDTKPASEAHWPRRLISQSLGTKNRSRQALAKIKSTGQASSVSAMLRSGRRQLPVDWPARRSFRAVSKHKAVHYARLRAASSICHIHVRLTLKQGCHMQKWCAFCQCQSAIKSKNDSCLPLRDVSYILRTYHTSLRSR